MPPEGQTAIKETSFTLLDRLLSLGKTRVPNVAPPSGAAAAAELSGENQFAPAQVERAVAPPVVGVLGAKGGSGATTIAVNLAVAIASMRVRTTLIDANLQQPDLAHLVGVEPPHSLLELLERIGDLDRQLYEACCIDVLDKNLPLRLLSPALNGEAAVQTNLSQVARCLEIMRSYSDAWIVDMPRHLDRHLVTLADMCDRIVLVFEATVSGVATCQRWLGQFKELGYEDERVVCVVNRAGSKFKAVEEHLTDCFGDRRIFTLPNASAAIWDSSTRELPLASAQPNHIYSRAVTKLAQELLDSMRRGAFRG